MSTDCLPTLTAEQHEALLNDINDRGVQNAIEYCASSGEILDGRIRVEICKQLKIRNYPRRVVSGLESDEDRRHYRLKANCLRRQLDRTVLKEMVLAELRKKPQSDRGLAAIFGVSHPTIGNWRREWVSTGKLLPVSEFEGVNGKTYKRPTSIYTTSSAGTLKASKLLNDLGDAAPGRTISALRAGMLSLQNKRENPDQSTVPLKLPAKVKIYEGRFQDEGDRIKSNSVDCVLTDPPYGGDWTGQWSDLGELAIRVLKPGGLLIAYSGIGNLDKVMSALSTAGLTYVWTVSVPYGGHQVIRNHGRNINNLWKPILIYGKGTCRLPDNVPDLVQSNRDKERHEWEQPEAETEHFLSRLVPEGGTVMDPCCGSGTTLAVARRLGMTAIGIDSDPGAISLARTRLGKPVGKGKRVAT